MEKCNESIRFGDDNGDNVTTFHCQLEKGHSGKHKESGDMSYDEDSTLPYTLEWEDIHKKRDQSSAG